MWKIKYIVVVVVMIIIDINKYIYIYNFMTYMEKCGDGIWLVKESPPDCEMFYFQFRIL
jgi:hypothetical protein